jgi:hypothetical protein
MEVNIHSFCDTKKWNVNVAGMDLKSKYPSQIEDQMATQYTLD